MKLAARRPGRPAAALAVLVLGLVAAALGGHVRPTVASFNDSGTMESTSNAHTVLPPASLSCTNVGSGGSVRLSFPHRDSRYDYTVQIARTSNGNVVTTRGGTVTGSGTVSSTQYIDVDSGFTPVGLLNFGAVNYTATVRSKLKSSATWVSSTTASTRLYETRRFLDLTYDVFCGTG